MQQRFKRDFDQLTEIVSFTDRFFQQYEIDPRCRYVVDLCVEELFVNMVTYDTETDEDIVIDMKPMGQGVEVSITDHGVERFDPRNAPQVDVNAPLDERTPGGLGLYLVLSRQLIRGITSGAVK